MPTPVKPCDGHFTEEVLNLLETNKDRAQWASHTCQVCGIEIGATIVKGKWVPEQHWPTVHYRPRKTSSNSRTIPSPASRFHAAIERETVNR